eukprot:334915_1
MLAPRRIGKLQTLFNLSIRRKHSINHSFLDNGLISHQHAWFWGMLLTDGNISRYSLRWNQKYDSYLLLDSIRTVIQSTHPIAFEVKQTKNKLYAACYLAMHSKQLTTTACSLIGCLPKRKTFDLKYPDSMNPVFTPSLIRGIIDGDGSWVMQRRTKTNYPMIYLTLSSANITFLQSVRNAINLMCLESRSDLGKIYSNKTYFELKYHCQSECNQIGEWMYNNNKMDVNNGLVLPKKLNRFLLFQELFIHQNDLTGVDKRKIMDEFKEKEESYEKMMLKNIVAMSKNKTPAPLHYTFRKQFMEFANNFDCSI